MSTTAYAVWRGNIRHGFHSRAEAEKWRQRQIEAGDTRVGEVVRGGAPSDCANTMPRAAS